MKFTEDDYIRFKHLLEYFVAHLEYMNSGKDITTRGYNEYIKPLVDKNEFKKTGQGYKNENIQKQIKGWDIYGNMKICINIQNHQKTRDYTTKSCYLNWYGTSDNIIANWNNNIIESLQITNHNKSGNKDSNYEPKTLNELGLFDKESPNETLKSFLNDFYELYSKDNNMAEDKNISEIVELLQYKKNIILQGAPGTGKTYTTAEIALSIIGEDTSKYKEHKDLMKGYENLKIKSDKDTGEIIDGQIGFVTFHQSMDYEDFIEGIKPEIENGNVYYDIKDGIFKKIAKRAKSKIENYEEFEEAYAKFIDYICDYTEANPFAELETESQKSKFGITVNNKKGLSLYTGDDLKPTTTSLKKDNLCKLFFNEIDYKDVSNAPYYKGVLNYLKRKYKLQEPKVSTKSKNYVLIIDEINRGNVSKIFGELITLLEADKRDEADHPLSVILPYSKKEFSIPSNLYIIGTMNTTDRSVGNIDYAVRRRFAFVTLESKREVVLEKNNNDEKALAVHLFDTVKTFLEKNKTDMDIEDLMVGHSYFLAEDEDELELKWKYEILPLLREYYKDGIIKTDVKKDCTIDDFIKENSGTPKTGSPSDNEENSETSSE